MYERSESRALTLDDATQDIADLLGLPVVIFDTDLNVLAYSVHERRLDRSRLKSIGVHQDSALVERLIARSKARNTDNPLLLPGMEGAPPRVLVPLRHGGHHSGYLSYAEPDANLASAQSVHLKRATEQLGALIALHKFDRQRKGNAARQLIEELLDPNHDVRKAAADTLVARELITEASRYAALVVKSPIYMPGSREPEAILAVDEALRFISKATTLNAVGAAIGDEGVVVIPRPVNRNRLLRMLDQSPLEQVNAGAGSTRQDLSEVVESYREAQISWQATQRLPRSYGRVAHWDDLGVDRILLQLPFDSIRIEDLPAGIVTLLQAQSGFDLAETLDCYLSCSGHAQQTARILHIHRSTLYYRLDRITELLGQDLSQGEVRREAQMGLHLARLAGFWADDGTKQQPKNPFLR